MENSQLPPEQEAELSREFARHRERLWRLARFRLSGKLMGRLDPDDVLQEAFLAARSRLSHCQAQASGGYFIWLRMIVLQTMIDLHRQHAGAQRRAVDREVSLRNSSPSHSTSASIAGQLLARNTPPSHAAMRHELADRLEGALEHMEPIDREVLALRHFEELTNSEAAEVLGIQSKAASIRYVRALQRLKKLLEDFPELKEASDGG